MLPLRGTVPIFAGGTGEGTSRRPGIVSHYNNCSGFQTPDLHELTAVPANDLLSLGTTPRISKTDILTPVLEDDFSTPIIALSWPRFSRFLTATIFGGNKAILDSDFHQSFCV